MTDYSTVPLVLEVTTHEFAVLQDVLRERSAELEQLCDAAETSAVEVPDAVLTYRDAVASLDEKLTNYL